jgi:ssDNA-binding Zn-finger/Zn-ribbon topoisomerase 1
MPVEVKQPVAWELRDELRAFVDVRPNMQPEEWRHKFSRFWPHSWERLNQSDARLEMFDKLSASGLSQRHYASELDSYKANNDGWRAKISDISFVCSAFPICDVGVCHHRSIEHRRGYEDKNGRPVPSHAVRSFFGHRGKLSERLSDLHKAAMDQHNHNTAIDMMLSHLLMHRAGFFVIDTCPKCKKQFEALRILKPSDCKPKLREYDENNVLKFEYDIGVLGDEGKLKAIFEALNTHKMGAEKRSHAEDNGFAWIEYSVPAMLLSGRKDAIHSRPGGWLVLDALKLKIGHSGAAHCQTCTADLNRERAAVERRERIRNKINEGEESRRKVMRELIEPAEQEVDQITDSLGNMEPGFSSASIDKMELELANNEFYIKEIQDRLLEGEQLAIQLEAVEFEVESEIRSRKAKSFCSKTGLELTTEFNETVIKGFRELSLRIDNLKQRCFELLDTIDFKRRELTSYREWDQ